MTGYRGIKRKTHISEELKDKMWKLYNNWIWKWEIAKQLWINKNTVYWTIRYF